MTIRDDEEYEQLQLGQPPSLTIRMNDIHPEVLHLLIGCPRPWPHEGVECCFSNIILGEE